ncbi:MAG: BON domain-containing protein [Pirellula sp.]|jgi:osmotically-inducible protein OsmY|nr:BON domain-containing protein [Pirellula sp.]
MASGPLLHRIDRAIQKNPHSIRSRIYLESAPGKVILRGKVDSFYQKQMIQESLRNIEGIECIANLLEVEESIQTA